MNIFVIVVVMALTAPARYTDLYIIQDPSFEGKTACVDFVMQNYGSIKAKAESEFPNNTTDEIYCVNKNNIQALSQNVLMDRLEI